MYLYIYIYLPYCIIYIYSVLRCWFVHAELESQSCLLVGLFFSCRVSPHEDFCLVWVRCFNRQEIQRGNQVFFMFLPKWHHFVAAEFEQVNLLVVSMKNLPKLFTLYKFTWNRRKGRPSTTGTVFAYGLSRCRWFDGSFPEGALATLKAEVKPRSSGYWLSLFNQFYLFNQIYQLDVETVYPLTLIRFLYPNFLPSSLVSHLHLLWRGRTLLPGVAQDPSYGSNKVPVADGFSHRNSSKKWSVQQQIVLPHYDLTWTVPWCKGRPYRLPGNCRTHDTVCSTLTWGRTSMEVTPSTTCWTRPDDCADHQPLSLGVCQMSQLLVPFFVDHMATVMFLSIPWFEIT